MHTIQTLAASGTIELEGAWVVPNSTGNNPTQFNRPESCTISFPLLIQSLKKYRNRRNATQDASSCASSESVAAASELQINNGTIVPIVSLQDSDNSAPSNSVKLTMP